MYDMLLQVKNKLYQGMNTLTQKYIDHVKKSGCDADLLNSNSSPTIYQLCDLVNIV